jgi:hypothetical protein
MPLTDASNPQGMMGQQAPSLGTEAPQGSGMMASPSAGLPPMAPGTSQATAMISQIAANLLKKQQSTKYTQALLKHLGTILTKAVGGMMFEDPSAKGDVMDAIKKLENAGIKVGKSGPTDSPALSTSLADMVGRAGNSGATA